MDPEVSTVELEENEDVSKWILPSSAEPNSQPKLASFFELLKSRGSASSLGSLTSAGSAASLSSEKATSFSIASFPSSCSSSSYSTISASKGPLRLSGVGLSSGGCVWPAPFKRLPTSPRLAPMEEVQSDVPPFYAQHSNHGEDVNHSLEKLRAIVNNVETAPNVLSDGPVCEAVAESNDRLRRMMSSLMDGYGIRNEDEDAVYVTESEYSDNEEDEFEEDQDDEVAIEEQREYELEYRDHDEQDYEKHDHDYGQYYQPDNDDVHVESLARSHDEQFDGHVFGPEMVSQSETQLDLTGSTLETSGSGTPNVIINTQEFPGVDRGDIIKPRYKATKRIKRNCEKKFSAVVWRARRLKRIGKAMVARIIKRAE
ncbi:hypothetical protein RUND412_008311 [Rhizina undulata]